MIDTTKFAFGRYYKFEIPAIIKATAKDELWILKIQQLKLYTNTIQLAELLRNPEKPTEKRVVN